MLAKSWKKILIILCAIAIVINLIVKLINIAPYYTQVNSVVTRDLLTEEEINKIKEEEKLKGNIKEKEQIIIQNEEGNYELADDLQNM